MNYYILCLEGNVVVYLNVLERLNKPRSTGSYYAFIAKRSLTTLPTIIHVND